MVDRIKLIMDYNSLAPNDFANEIGVSKSTISHIFSGRNNPSLDVISNILKRFPLVSSEWLLRGIGDMIIKKSSETSMKDLFENTQNIQHSPSEEGESDNNVYIDNKSTPEYNEKANSDENVGKRIHAENEKSRNNLYQPDRDEIDNRNTINTSVNVSIPNDLTHTSKRIKKVIIFYDNNTFEVYTK